MVRKKKLSLSGGAFFQLPAVPIIRIRHLGCDLAQFDTTGPGADL